VSEVTVQHEALAQYLKVALGGVVQVQAIRPLTGDEPTFAVKEPGVLRGSDLKAFGYGQPIQIDLLLNGIPRSYVLSTMRSGPGFGHDHMADRAGALIWAHDAYGKLARHVGSLDVGFFTGEGQLQSAGRAEEYFLLMEKVDGAAYSLDLERIRTEGMIRVSIGPNGEVAFNDARVPLGSVGALLADQSPCNREQRFARLVAEVSENELGDVFPVDELALVGCWHD